MLRSDILSGALSALRISASIVLDERYAAPWAIEVPASSALGRIAESDPHDRVVAFHIAERGDFVLATNSETIAVGPGELVVCFGGTKHRMSRGARRRAIPIAEILSGKTRAGAPNAATNTTDIMCGLFVLRDPMLNPLLGALPDVIHMSMHGNRLEPLARMLMREVRRPEQGSSFVTNRLLEALCAGLIRSHFSKVELDSIGLIRALADSRLCSALEWMHRAPNKGWSVESLAVKANLSRSRFSALFRKLMGEGPMVYLTRWRMNVAARMLRHSGRSVAEIGRQVGYDSPPAFSRVFKRHAALSPAQFRESVQASRRPDDEAVHW